MSNINLYKKTWKYIKPSKYYLVGFLIISLLEAASSIIFPIVSAKIILNMTSGIINELFYSALAMLILDFLLYIVQYLKSFFYRKINFKTLINLQKDLALETLKLEVSEVDKASTGLFIDRLTKDTSEISSTWMEGTFWISVIMGRMGILVSIFILNKYIFLYTVFVAIIMFLITRMRLSKTSIINKKIRKVDERKTSIISEMVRGIRDIKVLNASSNAIEKVTNIINDSSNEQINLSKVNSKYVFINKLADSTCDFVFIFLGIFLYKNSLLTIPAFVVAYHYGGSVKTLLSSLAKLLEFNKKFIVSSERIYEVIDSDKFNKEKFGDKVIKKLDGNIKFDNVTFGYSDKNILNNISFEIKPNTTCAFVGKSGAGKTTIFNLITKLYDVKNGEILLDNNNISDLTCDSIRNNISIINQDPYFFNFSIKDNLLISNSHASLKKIREVCSLACIDDYIMSLPDKYDTILGENGTILSGGQKQRLAIARAMLTNTEIILFDEATSALDNETQSKIKEAIRNLKGEYTILIIAHRLSTIIDSDKIFVIDDGKVLDSGTHKELIERCNFYKNLYNKDLDK